jgi:hypothetical protein
VKPIPILLAWPNENTLGTIHKMVIDITDKMPIEPPITQYKNHFFSLGNSPDFAKEYD